MEGRIEGYGEGRVVGRGTKNLRVVGIDGKEELMVVGRDWRTVPSPTSLFPYISRISGGISVPPPSFLKLLFINISAVRLSWNYPSNGDSLPIHFVVQMSHDGNPYMNISNLISEFTFVYNGMLFAAYYQFQVLACFEGVVSKPTKSDYFINGVTGKVSSKRSSFTYQQQPCNSKVLIKFF